MRRRAISGAALTVSLAAHAWLLMASGQGNAAPRRPRAPTFMQLTVAAAQPAAAPDPAPPPEPPAVKAAPRLIVPKAKPAVAQPEPPPPALETPSAAPLPELTGTTLVTAAERGAGWSAPPGSGAPRDGMVRAGAVSSVAARISPEAKRKSQAAQPPQLPEALPLSQLSRKPSPPPLTAALERNYPPAARSIGQSGDASVRARIEANGNVRLASIVVETARGFGDACRRTLLASLWIAPLDRAGKPVATWITYRCKFRIDG